MSFNADKCHILKITRHRTNIETSYHIEGKKLSQVPNHPYLGVELTSDLTWKIHISNITGKANKILNLLRRHLYNCSTEVKSRAFTSLVRPHLEYASSVWDAYFKQDINQLEKVQRKDARFVCGKYQYTESVTSMLTELDWKPLQQRRKNRRLTNFYKVINQLTPVIILDYIQTPIRFTRTHDQALVQLPANYEQYKNSFIPRTIRDWNSLPPELVHVKTVDEFSSRLQLLTA